MRQATLAIILAAISVLLSSGLATAQVLVHHDLKAVLDPASNHIAATDAISLPKGYPKSFTMRLHGNLTVTPEDDSVRIDIIRKESGYLPISTYKITLPPDKDRFTLQYSGAINHPPETHGREYARGFQQTPGIIASEGVYLSGASLWYPVLETEHISFSLQTSVPPGWLTVSQGNPGRTPHESGNAFSVWDSQSPQEEIFLIAAPFQFYTKTAGPLTAMVFLHDPDPKLAGKYLDATVQYIALYEKMIGPYPYSKFALVENFWETGYGMPSFTLLGPKVIRFPFILHSSYPHEILHNWWGNSVYPDFQRGNWSEGLTAYLADHLIKEQQGGGAEYRQATLQKYADYASQGRDFPLIDFTSRHSSATEAVGYGKSLMFFHMLRKHLSDGVFVQGLQHFYEHYRFRTASFAELRKSFEAVSARNLQNEFDQWLTRTGAPKLIISAPLVDQKNNEYLLRFTLEQIQPEPPYSLQVPVAVTLEDREQAFQIMLPLTERKQIFSLELPAPPLRIDADPEFDLFRLLDREETPPALSQAFGAQKTTVILPASCSPQLAIAYQELAQAWKGSGPENVRILLDSEISVLPQNEAVVLFGWENRFRDLFADSLREQGAAIEKDSLRFSGTLSLPRRNHAFALVSRLPANQDHAFAWVAIENPAAAAGLGRKLPHYHKYSYLAFEGDEPENVAKGRWPILHSPLTLMIPGKETAAAGMAELEVRQPLAAMPRPFSPEPMQETISFLAGDAMRGRGFGSTELDAAASYIAEQFKINGLLPLEGMNSSFFQSFQARGGNPSRDATLRNVVGIVPGTDPALKNEYVVIGAHYDHLGLGWPDVHAGQEGSVHPGADDNASGIAVLLELARFARESLRPDRSVLFAAFSGEEAGKLGSRHFVARAQDAGHQIFGMINLDTVGRLGKGKLLVLNGGSAREWVHIFRGAGFVTGVEVETVTEPLDSSDQTSFLEANIPAVQLFSGPNPDYHRPTDTPAKIDAEGLVKVALVAKEAIEYLAAKEARLTPAGAQPPASTAPNAGTRKVSIGTIPDFAYAGKGYRLSGVVDGSPAAVAGMREGDVVTRVNDTTVESIQEMAAVLKKLVTGQTLQLFYLRDGIEKQASLTVADR